MTHLLSTTVNCIHLSVIPVLRNYGVTISILSRLLALRLSGRNIVAFFSLMICRKKLLSSSCSRYGLIQFKIVHRVHFTKFILAKIYPNIYPARGHCRHATLKHIFWTYPTLHIIWVSVFNSLSDVYMV